MPVATPFNALGAGNGFTGCLSKIDVSDRGDGSPYDYWKAMPLADAMSLFWNLYGLNGSGSATLGSQSASAGPAVHSVGWEPSGMVCNGVNVTSDYDEDINEFEEGVAAKVEAYIVPVRLYNGDTSDEGNFQGYGISSNSGNSAFAPIQVYATFIPDFGTPETFVSLSSLIANYAGGSDEDVAYVTVSGIDFVAYARGPTTRSASGLSATFGTDISSSITGIDFYTYP